MIKKRLVGVVTVRNGWAVQSIGYSRYLPLGRPEVLVENLDRWGADEIFVQCIDRTRQGLGPDFALIERIGQLGISTPLIYGGGVASAEQARQVVNLAADRVSIDALLRDDPREVRAIAGQLGAQAVIAALPVAIDGDEVRWLDYRTGRATPMPVALIEDLQAALYRRRF
jgi:cyclase